MRTAIAAALVALSLLAPAGTAAASQDIMLGFGSLPSSQGFTYNAVGSHAAVAESAVFSAGGGTLFQDTIGQALGTAGGGLYYTKSGVVNPAEPCEIHVSARCLQVQGSSVFPAGQGGIGFGLTNGTTQYAFSLTPTKAYVLGAGGWIAVSGTWDNTLSTDWTLAYDPPATCRLYRNGALVSTTTGGGALALNRIFLGDLTGGANARAEVTGFHFLQGGAVATEASNWGRVKALFR